MYLCTTPEPDKWFRVDIRTIDSVLFEEKRSDRQQEIVRKMIRLSLDEAKHGFCYPVFYTTFPTKNWNKLSINRIVMMSEDKIGDGIATIIMQGLEWAQRISNNESWEQLCNRPDQNQFYRMVKWYIPESFKKIGGSRAIGDRNPETDYFKPSNKREDVLCDTVPLVYRLR